MIKNVDLVTCDACKKSITLGSEEKLPDGWIHDSGCNWDLCPSCAVAWKTLKQSFIEKMRMNNLEDLK